MRFGREDAPIEQNVTISGLNIEAQHAVIENNDGRIQLTLPTPGAKMFVNGLPVTTPVQLRHNDRVIFGNNHVFKVIIPSEAKSYVRPDDVPGVIDHTFAVMEINKAQVQAIAAAEAARRAEAEAARLKAEEQIREIEAQLAEERRKAEAEAAERQKYFEAKEKELLDRRQQGFQSELKEQEDRLRKEKEDMLRVMQEQQKVLEEKLQHQIEETNKQAKRKETEAKQRR
jgi:FHA domain